MRARVIVLRGKTKDKFAIVDNDDYEYLSQFRWFYSKSYWGHEAAERKEKGRHNNIKMHRKIMGFPVGKDIDHINHNTLDNRKENLRICTHAENMRNMKLKINNTSGIRGVSFHSGKWDAYIKINYKKIHLGRFLTKEDAIKARLEGSKKYHKEFGGMNFA